MKVTIEKNEIVIRLPFDEEGKESKSTKSLNHATTNGNQQVAVGGKVLNIGVNVYSSNPNYKPEKK